MIYTEPAVPEKQIWMLGFFDVLGFSQRVKNEGADRIYNDYEKLIQNVLAGHTIETGGMVAPTFTGGSLVSMGGCIEINYTYFSDTILLWMPFLPMYPKLFLQRCADLMCEALLMKIPLRGAISIGEGYMHKGTGIYIGEHIVDAARLEAAQEHIGVAMTSSIARSALISVVSPTQYIEYETPIKSHFKYDPQEFCSPIALDWPRRWRDCKHRDLIQCLEELRTTDATSKYYDNAIKFAKWSEDHNDWHLNPDKFADFKHLIPLENMEHIADRFPKQWREMKAAVRAVSVLKL